MRALITGANGFLGRRLARRVCRDPRYSQVVLTGRREATPACGTYVRCDLTDAAAVRKLLGWLAPDVIFHLAGNPLIRSDPDDPAGVTRDNVLTTHHLLAWAPPGCRFLLASSAAVYGDRATHGVSEDVALTPGSAYGASKAAAEYLSEAYTRLGLVNAAALRLVALAGPGATHGLVRDVVAKLQGDSPTLDLIGAPPGSRKHVLHVDDAADAFVYFAGRREARGPFNVAGRTPVTVLQVAGAVADVLGVRKPVRWLGEAANWKGDNRVVHVSNGRAHYWGLPEPADSLDAVRRAVRDILEEQTQA